MTKEITKARIIQEIQDKFKLRELAPELFSFSEQVVPVYNIESHVVFHTARYNVVSVTSGPTGFNVSYVPSNERWIVRGYNVVFMAAGAYTVTGLYITRKKEKYSNSFVYLDMKEGQTVSYAVNLPSPLVLEPGDGLWVYIDSYTSTADLRVYTDYQVEELR